MSARSQFTPTKADEQFRGYGFTIGGALVKEKSNFSVSVNGQNNYTTPNLNVALPNGQQRFDVLRLRQPFDRVDINGLFDYALTRDQTLRFGYSENHNSNAEPRESAPTIFPNAPSPRRTTATRSARSKPDRSAGGCSSTLERR